MQVLPSFNPGATPNGLIDVSAADPGCKILLYNLSIVAIKLNFENGQTAILHAGEANWWELDGSTPTIEWSQYSVLTASTGPISQVNGILYRQDEKVQGNYPFNLVYLLNLGNPVPLNTSVDSIVNSGNAAGTPIVTSTVLGDADNAVSITNDAQITFGDAAHPAAIDIVGTVDIATINASNAVNSDSVNCNTVNCGTVNCNEVNCNEVNLQTLEVNTGINLVDGSVSRVHYFSGSGTTVVSHNFGVVPTLVLVNYAGNFGGPPTENLAWHTETTTQVTIKGQIGFFYKGVVIKA